MHAHALNDTHHPKRRDPPSLPVQRSGGADAADTALPEARRDAFLGPVPGHAFPHRPADRITLFFSSRLLQHPPARQLAGVVVGAGG